jgi:riboflavin kinase/FMN adenylyltransferase
MKLIRAAAELKPGKKVCLALGFFDGVHLGHQQIIQQTIADAQAHEAVALVVTFDEHPNAVVAPSQVPPLIYSLPQRIRTIESLGAEALLVLRFDKPFSEQSGETFIRQLACDLGGGGAPTGDGLQGAARPSAGAEAGSPDRRARSDAPGHNLQGDARKRSAENVSPGSIRSVCVGEDFVFGYRRSGNVALLTRLGGEMNFTVHGIAAVSLEGQVVSSTRIREAIRCGDLEAAGRMLGRSYSLAARVVKGDQLGRKLGFPTANLEVNGLVLPPKGVYAARVLIQGRSHEAVLNIGHRPTVQSPTPQLRVEVHLLKFTGELYGEELAVNFLARLRDEREFASLDDLKNQIARDIGEARRRF